MKSDPMRLGSSAGSMGYGGALKIAQFKALPLAKPHQSREGS
jgi:hypothetical protein